MHIFVIWKGEICLNCPKMAKNCQKMPISPTFASNFAKIAKFWLVWRISRAKNRWRFSQKSCSQPWAKFRGFGEKSPKLATLKSKQRKECF